MTSIRVSERASGQCLNANVRACVSERACLQHGDGVRESEQWQEGE